MWNVRPDSLADSLKPALVAGGAGLSLPASGRVRRTMPTTTATTTGAAAAKATFANIQTPLPLPVFTFQNNWMFQPTFLGRTRCLQERQQNIVPSLRYALAPWAASHQTPEPIVSTNERESLDSLLTPPGV